MKEITRGETFKIYDLGKGKRRLVLGGVCHWKNDYSDEKEEWKDPDLTWENNKITKAPYILEKDEKKLTFTDRKTGEVSTIELISAKPEGLEYKIIPFGTGFHYQHILDNSLFEAQFKITGKPPKTRAFDDLGELELETSFKDGILTEKLTECRDLQTKELRKVSGKIRIDPTYQVGASADDGHIKDPDVYANDLNSTYLGRYDYGGKTSFHNWQRFTNVTIPQGATITSAKLTYKADVNASATTCMVRISGDDTDDAAAPIDYAGYTGKTITTATVDWTIAAWTKDTDYDSPEIKTIIQEIVDRANWESGNAMQLFCKDNGSGTTASRTAYSYDGSSANAPKLVVEFEAQTATLTGTAMASITSNDVRTGSKTIIITLAGATWGATVGADNEITTALINGITSAQSEATGWNAEVRDKMTHSAVVRTSDTVVTITLPATAGYAITAQETIEVTVPASATSHTDPLVATPTFTVDFVNFISGEVVMGATDVEGATVRLVNQTDESYVNETLTNASGKFNFEGVDPTKKYHAIVEFKDTAGTYGDENQMYNALSLWDITPVKK